MNIEIFIDLVNGWWVIFILIIIFSGFRIIRPVQQGLVERFGKLVRVSNQGLRWVIPFVEKMQKVNITEIRLDVEKQLVITKDNLNLEIDAVVYFKIIDVKKAMYNVQDYMGSIPSLAQTTLRSIIGELDFTEVNAQRQVINAKIETELDTQTQAWGIDILRVELQDVRPSQEVQNAMDKVVTAEREKEALITRAIADKEAVRQSSEADVILAEAHKQAVIEKAEGEAQKIKLESTAKSEAIKIVNNAIEESFHQKSKDFKSLEVTENSLKRNTKFILSEKGLSPSIIINESKESVIPVTKKHIVQK